MTDLYGYKYCIFYTIYHNGKFSHNYWKYQTVIGTTERDARAKLVDLDPTEDDLPGLHIRCEPWIHDYESLGRVYYRLVREFDGCAP